MYVSLKLVVANHIYTYEYILKSHVYTSKGAVTSFTVKHKMNYEYSIARVDQLHKLYI